MKGPVATTYEVIEDGEDSESDRPESERVDDAPKDQDEQADLF
jgi:hypothetical protein